MRRSMALWAVVVAAIGLAWSATVEAVPFGSTTFVSGNYAGIPVSAADLINGMSPASTDYSATHEGGPIENLTNGDTYGSGGDGPSSNSSNAVFDRDKAFFAEYQLDLTASPNGYDLTQIDSVTGHKDGRVQQAIDIVLKRVGSSALLSLSGGGSFAHTGVSNGAGRLTITDDTGTLASNVEAIRFVNVGHPSIPNTTGTIYRELDVFGVPSASPPVLTEIVHLNLAAAGILNSDAVINTGGAEQPHDTVQNAPDGNSFVTQLAATLLGPGPAGGLPDDGIIPAGTGDVPFDVVLNYHNGDDGNNGLTLFNPADTATVDLVALGEEGIYTAVYVFATNAGGDGELDLALHYADGSMGSAAVVVEDWFDDTGGSDYLIDALDRASNNGSSYHAALDPAIFAYEVTTDFHSPLVGIDFSRSSSGNNLVIMGVSGVRGIDVIPEPATLTLSAMGLLALAHRRRRRRR